jgi:cysteine dioxygenase
VPAHHARLSPDDLLGITLPPRADGPHAEAEMRSVIEQLSIRKPSWDLLGPHVAFNPAGYLRKRLFRDDDWEMLLLCWLPGQRTVVHDHGGSWGAVVVLSGQLDECQYKAHGQGHPLTMCQLQRFGAGEVALEKVETIHKNENRSEVPAISLHLYSPPLKVLNSFDPLSGRSHAVRVHEGPTIAVGGKPVSSRGKPLGVSAGR